MVRYPIHIGQVIFFLVFALAGYGQQQAPKISVDRNKILIGEPIQMTLEAKLAPGSVANWFVIDSLKHFDLVDKAKVDTSTIDGSTVYRQRLTITSFDSGSQVIPPLTLDIDHQHYLTDSVNIEVGYSPAGTQQDYHDIKDIFAMDNPAVKAVIWVVLAITLISLASVVYLLRRKALPVTAPGAIVSSKSPFDEAMASLKTLKGEHLPEKGQVKLYYTRMNDILRVFVLRKLQMASLEKTNEELILQLRQLNIAPAAFSQLAESLRMSDYVKFAKYLPGEIDNERNYTVMESSVHLLNDLEK